MHKFLFVRVTPVEGIAKANPLVAPAVLKIRIHAVVGL